MQSVGTVPTLSSPLRAAHLLCQGVTCLWDCTSTLKYLSSPWGLDTQTQYWGSRSQEAGSGAPLQLWERVFLCVRPQARGPWRAASIPQPHVLLRVRPLPHLTACTFLGMKQNLVAQDSEAFGPWAAAYLQE